MNEQLPQIIYRIVTDANFREAVVKNPQVVLAGLGLNSAETNAITHTLALPNIGNFTKISAKVFHPPFDAAPNYGWWGG